MAERDGTQQVLLDSAIRLFGQHGYEAVSTRMLAEHAGVNLAAIKYHFGSKDELYTGAIDAIIALIQPRLDMMAGIANQIKSVAGDDPQRQALVMTQLIHTILTTFLETPALQKVIPFILRELFAPGPHFKRMYTGVPKRLHEMLTDLVAWILGIEPDSVQAKVRAHAVVGQMIVFQIGRPILLNRLAAETYSATVIDEIRAQVTTSVLSSLGLPHEA